MEDEELRYTSQIDDLYITQTIEVLTLIKENSYYEREIT